MIARLRGHLLEKAPQFVVVDCGGVGYHAFVSLTTFCRLPEPGATVDLVVVTNLRENALELSVEDCGPGIPPEIQLRIFDPFFTTKPPGAGTGLGLHIAYSIVSRHRGQIQVTSRPGATRFQVSLPIQLQ